MVGANETLSVAVATEMVWGETCRLDQANVIVWFAPSCELRSLAGRIDTLVVMVPVNTQDDALGFPAKLRDALTVWHAVSRCRGFSFTENFAFWLDALALTREQANEQHSWPVASRAFPRVVVYWHYKGTSTPDQVGAVVERLLRPPPLSESTEQTLATLAKYDRFRHEQEILPIELVLRLHFEKTMVATKPVIKLVLSKVTAGVANGPQMWPICRLAGLEIEGDAPQMLSGLTTSQLTVIQNLCTALPSGLSLTVQYPLSGRQVWDTPARRYNPCTPVDRCKFGTFLRSTCTLQASSQATGRLQVLDLVNAFCLRKAVLANFESLCSLLPHTTSLRELRVRITDQSELMWLMYAMFHPRSTTHSAWTDLALLMEPIAVDWCVLERMVVAESRLAVLIELLHPETATGQTQTQIHEPATKRVLYTATLAKATKLLALDTKKTLASLARGCQVELPYTTSIQGNESTDSVELVFVPGYGFGYVPKSYLTPVVETWDTEETPRSCITALHASRFKHPLPQADQFALLRLVGLPLTHLFGHQMSWFQDPDFSALVPNVETLSCCRFTPRTAASGAALAAFPKLRALGVYCEIDDLGPCITALAHHPFTSLQELWLEISIDREGSDALALDSVQHLVRQLPLLQHLALVLSSIYNYHAASTRNRWKTELHVANKDLQKKKRAFLSAVYHAHSETELSTATESASHLLAVLARLDSYLLRSILDFSGRTLQSLEIVVGRTASRGQAVGPWTIEMDNAAECERRYPLWWYCKN